MFEINQFLCPILPQIVTRFSYFVSPLLPSASGDLRLVDSALISGIDAYVNELNQNGKARAFIVGIIDCALDIINGRVIRGRHGDHVTTWIPFTEPIGNWIERERIESIIIDNFEEENQVQSRSSLARVAIMVHILSFEEYSAIGFSEA